MLPSLEIKETQIDKETILYFTKNMKLFFKLLLSALAKAWGNKHSHMLLMKI